MKVDKYVKGAVRQFSYIYSFCGSKADGRMCFDGDKMKKEDGDYEKGKTGNHYRCA